jgi:uncharacterized cupredoxin-like copper-binding protein
MPRIIYIVLVVLGLIVGACASAGDQDAIPADAQPLTVSFGDSLAFEPPTLTVQVGRPVVLTVKNLGNTDHDFSIRDMPAKDITSRIEGSHGHGGTGMIVGHPKANSEVTVRFTPTAAGTYEFYCSVTGHRDAGMKGSITVV